jgi:hypothetical protein
LAEVQERDARGPTRRVPGEEFFGVLLAIGCELERHGGLPASRTPDDENR